jgi:hypothetical protein
MGDNITLERGHSRHLGPVHGDGAPGAVSELSCPSHARGVGLDFCVLQRDPTLRSF